jgi:DNA-directed RNA polymerase subunit K/omega
MDFEIDEQKKSEYSDDDDSENDDVESEVDSDQEEEKEEKETEEEEEEEQEKEEEEHEDEEEEDDEKEDEEEDDDDNEQYGGDNDNDNENGNENQPHVSDEDTDDEPDDLYLQKFNADVNKNYIADFHPECLIHNYDEIVALSLVIRDNKNNIIDDLHKSIPYLTKYERARVLGQRSKQINTGAKTFVKVPENVIDGYLIAEMELNQKRIPFIIRRPIPGGGCEYWNLKDLEIICF